MLPFFYALTLLLLVVIYLDTTRYIIPNWLNLVLLALYPAMVFMTPALPDDFNILWSLGIGLAFFAVGFISFAARLMGGGDVKLITVLGLWAGAEAGAEFIVLTAVFGGLLSLAVLFLRLLLGGAAPSKEASEDAPKENLVVKGGQVVERTMLMSMLPFLGFLGRFIPAEKRPRILQHGQPVPYGIAIAIAFLRVLWDGKIPGLPLPV